ncbi:MAG: hypothetical protein DRP06_00415 [Candidatus Aenigmatarchaeota archaeon]|nr:MAG: hypothetical protein DRP06_00415 [Candidatus Aenigmarchaeota archaeon]
MSNDSTQHFYANVSGLSQGQHNITFYCNDTAGNYNETTLIFFGVDTQPPQINLISPENNTLWKVSNNVTFYYKVSDFSNITNCSLLVDNSIINSWDSVVKEVTLNLTELLDSGNHNWSIVCVDSLGYTNSSEVRTLEVNADMLAPVINLVSPLNESNISEILINFLFNATDNIATLLNCSLYINASLRQNNNSVISGAETCFSNISVLEGLNQSWFINCSDDLSNSNVSPENCFSVDVTPPLVVINNPLIGAYKGELQVNASIQDSVSEIVLQKFRWENSSNVGLWIDLNGSINTTLFEDGPYSIRIFANDSFGNVNNTTFVQVTFDNTLPVINITHPLNRTYPINFLELNFTASDANPDACWYRINSGDNISVPGCVNGSIIEFQEGSNLITLWMNDSAGNINSVQRSLFVEICPVVINSFTSDTNYGYVNDSIYFEFNLTSSYNISEILLTFTLDNNTISVLNKSNFNYFANPPNEVILNVSYKFNNSGDINCKLNVTDVNSSEAVDSFVVSIYKSFINHTIILNVNSSPSVVNYRRLFDNSILTGLSSNLNESESIVLEVPNTSLNIEIVSNDSYFSIIVPEGNISNISVINISTKLILDSLVYDTASQLGGGQRYTVKYAYAINFENQTNISSYYLVYLNYLALGIGEIQDVEIFKCNYNFLNYEIDYGSCVRYALGGSPTFFESSQEGYLYLNISSFSVFILSEDQGVPQEPPGNDKSHSSSSSSFTPASFSVNHTIYPEEKDTWHLSVGVEDMIFFNLSDENYYLNVTGMGADNISFCFYPELQDFSAQLDGFFELNLSNITTLNISLENINDGTAQVVFRFITVFEKEDNNTSPEFSENSTDTNELICSDNIICKNVEPIYIYLTSNKTTVLIVISFILIGILSLMNIYIIQKQKKKMGGAGGEYFYLEDIKEKYEEVSKDKSKITPVTLQERLKDHIILLERLKKKLRSV